MSRPEKREIRKVYNRKLARNVARTKMKEAGFIRMNKETGLTSSPSEMRRGKFPVNSRSLFSKLWRGYI